MPAIILTTDQLNKIYIFQLTDENNKTITQYNNHTEYTLEEIVRILVEPETINSSIVTETNNPSINDTLRSHIKSFGSWLARIIEIR